MRAQFYFSDIIAILLSWIAQAVGIAWQLNSILVKVEIIIFAICMLCHMWTSTNFKFIPCITNKNF